MFGKILLHGFMTVITGGIWLVGLVIYKCIK